MAMRSPSKVKMSQPRSSIPVPSSEFCSRHQPFGQSSVPADSMNGIGPFRIGVRSKDVREGFTYCILSFDVGVTGSDEHRISRHRIHDRVEVVAVEGVGVGDEEFDYRHLQTWTCSSASCRMRSPSSVPSVPCQCSMVSIPA